MRIKPIIVCLIGGIGCLFGLLFAYIGHNKSSEIIWLIATVVCFVSAGIRYRAGKNK
jgi:ABC-type Mn2+/Zn2+ transport system permease subunit